MSAPAEKLARRFHDLYEQLAPGFGYKTREETRCFIPESPNGKLMIAVCEALAQAPEVQALIQAAVAWEREQAAGTGSLDDRLKANGMLSVDEVMQPMSRFQIHAGMTDLAAFGGWLERKVREYSTMRARYELGDRDKTDDLYEWVLAHSGAYHDVLVNFRVAIRTTDAPASADAGRAG